MRDTIRILLFGKNDESQQQLTYTGLGVTVTTTMLLLGARVLGEWAVGIGGLLLLGLMTLALVVGGYHAYRYGGVLWSLVPITGIVIGVAFARVVSRLVWGPTGSRGLQTLDVAVVLLGIGVVSVSLAYGVGRIWRRGVN